MQTHNSTMRVRNGVDLAMKRRIVRFTTEIALPLEIWSAFVAAGYKIGNRQPLTLLLVTVLVMFSIRQRLGTHALRCRSGSATAAALFDAILATWLIASVLPLT